MNYSGDFFYSAQSYVSLDKEIITWEGKDGEGDICLLSRKYGISLQLKPSLL